MNSDSKIYVAGHRGLVGSAVLRKLKSEGYTNLITRSHEKLDLTRQAEVESFFKSEAPEYVFLAAAKVGGILANYTYPADFIYNNIMIQSNVIHAAYRSSVKRLLFLGSSCIYPKDCPQPMKEEYVLSGKLEPTNEPYSIAKIAGIEMCESYNRQYGTHYLSVMPNNLYGPNDNFDLETSHVLAALIRKFHEGKSAHRSPLTADQERPSVVIWGTGKPRREFLHVDDLADACFFTMNLEEESFRSLLTSHDSPLINIGWGKDISINELALLIKDIVGFEGDITYETDKPDGMPRKLLDVSKMTDLGWKPRITLKEGIKQTYEWCLENSIF